MSGYLKLQTVWFYFCKIIFQNTLILMDVNQLVARNSRCMNEKLISFHPMPQDRFNQKKQHILKSVSTNTNDLSPKGNIDELCVPIINLINSSPDMVTTSSCSGRVSVFLEGAATNRPGKKGEGGKWIFISHDVNELDNWYNKLENETVNYDVKDYQADENTRFVLYKFEAMILHVACRDNDSAGKLFQAAMNCGFRETGIGKNNVVAIRISIKLDLPVAIYNNGLIDFIVDTQYLELITQLSKHKFQQNAKKINDLYESITTIVKPT